MLAEESINTIMRSRDIRLKTDPSLERHLFNAADERFLLINVSMFSVQVFQEWPLVFSTVICTNYDLWINSVATH